MQTSDWRQQCFPGNVLEAIEAGGFTTERCSHAQAADGRLRRRIYPLRIGFFYFRQWRWPRR